MRIIYLHQYFTTADSAGGTRSYEFARRLVRDGHEVHVVTSDRNASVPSSTWNVQPIEGISVHAIGQPYSNSMKPRQRVIAFLNFAIRSALRARSLRGDLIFATSTPLTIVLPALYAMLGRRVPFVMEVRDLWPSVPIALGYLRNPLFRFLAVVLERVAYSKATHIIALSDDMASGVVATGVPSSKVSVVTNMSDVDRFRRGDSQSSWFLGRYPQLAGRPFVVYTGTFGRVNGVDYMVRLAASYKKVDPRLAFVAMGEGAELSTVIELARELGVLDKNFFVLEQVPKKDLPEVLSAALACSSWVIPVKELEANSANKLFDAFAAGRPMLINHGGWQQKLLESTGAGLSLDAHDTELAARQLHKHVSDSGWLASARSASAELGRERFGLHQLYTKFRNVLECAVAVSPSSSTATDSARASQL
ncbi:glycosyltransferase family 4 protein [Pseudarthrobacter defluvii]|uniref:glycosyltransferase family 4 protein n=1 Tax=Pseudarthrobacter defluvii TaxID=410837 RepID=UPI0025774D99|nr:glycosyltransferase family 4 protein [Pseudarthrobacter defluvii]WJH23706.1 glycosyltransferase family 4 protein [Pseudarthrobacter defluvii]